MSERKTLYTTGQVVEPGQITQWAQSADGNKFNAHGVRTPEGWFASQKELRRWEELKLLAAGGVIRNLRRQVMYELHCAGVLRQPIVTRYVADFVYRETLQWYDTVEDAKGMRTEVYKIKKRWMLLEYGIEIRET